MRTLQISPGEHRLFLENGWTDADIEREARSMGYDGFRTMTADEVTAQLAANREMRGEAPPPGGDEASPFVSDWRLYTRLTAQATNAGFAEMTGPPRAMARPDQQSPLFLPRWMINEIRKQGGDPHAIARGYGFSHCEPYKPMPPLSSERLSDQ